MKKALRAIVLFVRRKTPAYQAKKRMELSVKLHRVFFMDSLEGSLDVLVRGKYGMGA